MTAKLTIVLLLLINSCVFKERSEKELCIKVESFKSFFDSFHLDSSFQISRINFPLTGNKISSSEYSRRNNQDSFYWSKDNWIIHKNAKVDTTIYKEEIKELKDSVFHRVWIENSGFEVIRKFKLKNCKWYLVYYSEMDI